MPLKQFAAQKTSSEDYINPQDGLCYCGKCRTPKEKYFEKDLELWGMKKHPVLCRCAAQEQEQQEKHFKSLVVRIISSSFAVKHFRIFRQRSGASILRR